MKRGILYLFVFFISSLNAQKILIKKNTSKFKKNHHFDVKKRIDNPDKINKTLSVIPPKKVQKRIRTISNNFSVENATLVNSSPFHNYSIDIFSSPLSKGGQSGCDIIGFNLIYYKFKAENDGVASAKIYDNFNSIGNSFVIFYKAEDLNITNESQLSLISNCELGQNTSVNVTKDTAYYIAIYRSDQFSSDIEINIPLDVSVTEKSNLTQLYNSLNGDNWTNNSNWNSTEPVSFWNGITVKDGFVQKIKLDRNNITGVIPNILNNFSTLEEFSIYYNNFKGTVPDLSSMNSLKIVDIRYNDFSFEDIETNFNSNKNLPSFYYERQNLKDDFEEHQVKLGDSKTLEMKIVPGTNVTYQWYRDRYGLNDVIIEGATSNIYEVQNINDMDMDDYYCIASSSTLPELKLFRNLVKLKGKVSEEQRNALIAIYNSTNGDNWTHKDNWLSETEPIDNWYGIKVTGNRVVRINLNNNNLLGKIPKDISALKHLESISFYGNKLLEELPPELGVLTDLKLLDLGGNSFTGEIPETYANLNKLNHLWLDSNELIGDVPEYFSTFTNLNNLVLNNNNFSGKLSKFPNLKLLNISYNRFQFKDLEDEFNFYKTLESSWNNNSYYSPQKNVSEEIHHLITPGENLSLSVTVSGSENSYQWYKGNNIISGETNASINLTNIESNQFGAYHCKIKNTLIPELILESGTFFIGLDPVTHPDYNALVALYNSTSGVTWENNSNWLDRNKTINSWYGISMENDRVKFINLHDNNLIGKIPNEIGNLEFLNTLQLSGNQNLYGEIPSGIGNLSNLEWLSLYNCSLWNDVPDSLNNLSNLKYLGLFNNQLTGKILENIDSLTKLKYIEINNNAFDGSISNSIVSFNSLESLLINGNYFSGNIPDFSKNTNLIYLYINDNKFQFGDFEDEFSEYQSSFVFSYAPQKYLDKNVDKSLAINESYTFISDVSGTNNTYFWFKRNSDGSKRVVSYDKDFTLKITSEDDYGDYDLEVTNSNITNLLLTSYPFTVGPNANTHPDFTALKAIYDSTNGAEWTRKWDLTSPISTWSGITFNDDNRIEILDLTYNNLKGNLPSEISDLTTLKQFWIFDNLGITGNVPLELWKLNKLTHLLIGYTNLKLPNGIPQEIKNMQELEWLNLSKISLQLPLQEELYKLPKLDKLRIQDCQIKGNLPKEFAEINDIFADRNEFEGEIPIEIINKKGNKRLSIQLNYFDFSDLQPLVEANGYEFLGYSPQFTRDEAIETTIAPGEDITFVVDDQGINRIGHQKNATGNIYQWFKNNILISGANKNSFTISNAKESDNGIYHCEIKNSLVNDLVIRRANITLKIDATAVLTNDILNEVSIYPNPVNNKFIIHLNNKLNADLSIYDITGKEVIKRKLNSKTTEVSVLNLKKGLYFASIISENKKIIKKIIKI
ncbi:putative secreted protein (Por secretion system target) [Lutibacter sp. Hel_I_33_5]|uniref:leucine-rich repeat domain-containing protein n=1 Tax=Lutibacter sp. Hel_I_33_5 TaxID=1566289 RepID=UPI0011A29A44|nr:T9SS type A sorting domain-containing protein [Lutibacter sp. Hel_I_33_5]TVZ54885.1 putative secreted protein (Por secretion system target) [Lutibacter sp. Hel_I_33_5]